MNLPYSLTRTVVIEAPRDIVFGFFTRSEQWATWWGKGSTIDAQPGGALRIVYPNAVEASGQVLEVAAPERIVFTFGYASGTPIAPGASRITIRLETVAQGTAVHLQHDFAEAAPCEQHVQGWRYQLSLFSNVVADAFHVNAPALIEAWYAAWNLTDGAARQLALAAICDANVQFQDRYSNFTTLADLNVNIGAMQRFMPGITLAAREAPRHCQGTVLSAWGATSPDGKIALSGTNIFRLNAQGHIGSVTGIAT
jgi:uncharacterized protein YndB with AHSA1/START domain